MMTRHLKLTILESVRGKMIPLIYRDVDLEPGESLWLRKDNGQESYQVALIENKVGIMEIKAKGGR